MKIVWSLLTVVLQQVNLTYFMFLQLNILEGRKFRFLIYLGQFCKEFFIALGDVIKFLWIDAFLDITNYHHIVDIRWYIPSSIKLPKWSSIFRILSVGLWLFLIISIVLAAISIILVG